MFIPLLLQKSGSCPAARVLAPQLQHLYLREVFAQPLPRVGVS